ncbi:hypothetical protein GEMRC1_009067 [Eukaryota sp. GEM-RC1]
MIVLLFCYLVVVVLSASTYIEGTKYDLKITTQFPGDGMSSKDVSKFVSSTIKHIHVNTTSPFACVDGRNDKHQPGTFGGSLAEFILALISVSKLYPSKDLPVTSLMSEYLNSNNSLYFHSDDESMGYLEDHLHHLGYPDVDLHNPPSSLQPLLLDLLVNNPKFTGCGHIKLLMTDEKYGSHVNLVHDVITSFFTLYWKKFHSNAMYFSVLHGHHQETAVVVVSSKVSEAKTSVVPAFCPFHDNHSSFVYHKDLVQKLRKSNSKWFGAYFDIDQDLLLDQINLVGSFWAKLTLERLATGLAIYELEVLPADRLWLIVLAVVVVTIIVFGSAMYFSRKKKQANPEIWSELVSYAEQLL